jgi:hypothetical protein
MEIISSGWVSGSWVLKETANGTVMVGSQTAAGNTQML